MPTEHSEHETIDVPVDASTPPSAADPVIDSLIKEIKDMPSDELWREMMKEMDPDIGDFF